MATYVLIASTTVGSGGTATITFSSIPSTYTDLFIKVSGRTDRASINDYLKVKFNGSTTGYTEKSLYGNGSGAQSETNNATTYAFMFALDGASMTASSFASGDIYIPNYAGSNYKSISSDFVQEQNSTTAIAAIQANLWSNSAAITSITIESATGNNLVQYSTAYLYGIKNS